MRIKMLVWLTARCVPVLIQQNVDASTFFNRSWAKFKIGFSDTRGNYWLGNDLFSQLTLSRRYKLRFDLQDRNLTWYYAEYSSCFVYGESRNYTLHVSGYSGNAGDSLSYHNGMIHPSISIYSFKKQLTHRNMITEIKQMIKKKNDKKIEVQQQSQYESLYNILTINKELLMY